MSGVVPWVAAVAVACGLLAASMVVRRLMRHYRLRRLVGTEQSLDPLESPGLRRRIQGEGSGRVGLPLLVLAASLAAVGMAIPGTRRAVLGCGGLLVLVQVVFQLRVRARMNLANQRLVADLPRLLELVTVCSTGGLSLSSAIKEAVRGHDGAAGRYFRELLRPTEAGVDLGRALKRGSADGPTAEVRSVCRTLMTAFVLGVPAAETLSELSRYVARRRRQELEEKIRTLPLRLTVVSVLLLLPPVVVLVVLPNVAAFLQSQW